MSISATKGPRSSQSTVWLKGHPSPLPFGFSARKKTVQVTPEIAAERRKMDEKIRSYESASFGHHAERVARGRW